MFSEQKTREAIANSMGWIAALIAEFSIRLAKCFVGKKGRYRTLLVVLAVGATFSFGQDALDQNAKPQFDTLEIPSAPTLGTKYPYDASAMVGKIAGSVDSALSSITSNGALSAMGTELTAFFLVLMLVWTSVKNMAAGKGFGELIGEWVPIFVSFGLVYAMLDKDVGNLIIKTIGKIGTIIGGQDLTDLGSAIKSTFTQFMSAIQKVAGMAGTASNKASSGFMDAIASFAASSSAIIFGLIVRAITAFVLIFALVISLGHIIVGTITLKLALALAPVMVPFLMFRPLSWIFESWLKFLISACMLRLVVGFLLSISNAIMGNTASLAQQISSEASMTAVDSMHADILLYGMVLVYSLISTLLLMQAPSIANGLMSGGGGMGFGGIKGLTQSPMGKAGGAVAGRGVSASKAGVVGGASGGLGAYHGLLGKPLGDNPSGPRSFGHGLGSGLRGLVVKKPIP